MNWVHHLLTCPGGVPAGVEEDFITTFMPKEQAWVKASMKSMYCVNLLVSTAMQGKLGSRVMDRLAGATAPERQARLDDFPDGLLYHPEHMWARQDGAIGITFYAQNQLGDIVFLEPPEAGSVVRAGKPCGSVESCKAVSDLYAPVSGTVTEVNAEAVNAPEIINRDPYGDGWIARVEPAGPGETDGTDGLLNAGDYWKLLNGE